MVSIVRIFSIPEDQYNSILGNIREVNDSLTYHQKLQKFGKIGLPQHLPLLIVNRDSIAEVVFVSQFSDKINDAITSSLKAFIHNKNELAVDVQKLRVEVEKLDGNLKIAIHGHTSYSGKIHNDILKTSLNAIVNYFDEFYYSQPIHSNIELVFIDYFNDQSSSKKIRLDGYSWDGTKVELIEIIHALYLQKKIRYQGEPISQKQLIILFSSIFSLDLKSYHTNITQMKKSYKRKEDGKYFLDTLLHSLKADFNKK